MASIDTHLKRLHKIGYDLKAGALYLIKDIMISILFILILILLIISLIIYDYDIISPPVIICAVYLFSVYAAMYNIDAWKINLSGITISYILIGLIVFCISSFIVKKKYANKPIVKKPITVIEFRKNKLIIIYLVAIVCTYLYLREVSSIVNKYGPDYNMAMADFRADFSYGEQNLSFISNQAYKVLSCISFVFLYVFCNNVGATNKWRKNLIFLVPVCLSIYTSLRSGSRAPLIQVFTMFVVLLFIFQNIYGRYEKRKILRYLLYISSGSIAFLIIFSAIRFFVGRQNESDLIDYISTYVGGSIQLFDLYLKHPEEVTSKGMETFGALYNNLAKLGFIDGKEAIMHKEFRYSNGILLGNVYTAFRAFHHDLGLFGIIFFQFIEGLFFTIYYEKIKRLKNKKTISIALVMYGILMMPLFEHAIQEQFFSNYMCLNTLVIYILILFIIAYLKPKSHVTKSF